MVSRSGARARALARIAALDADVLLAHVLGAGREQLYAHPEAEVPDGLLRRYEELVARRAAGEPVAYLRGFKEFYGLRIAVDRRVLIPRPETETLVEAVRARRPHVVADVGTGSGAIAVALAVNEPAMRVIATDISAEALAVAAANVESHGVEDRVELRQGDLLAPVTEQVDAVAANLPYLRDDAVAQWIGERASLAFEPAVAVLAGPDGLALIRRLVADLPRVLAPGGAAYIECDPPQAGALARRHGGEVLRDLAGDDRVVVIRRRD
jgi:release factor glutamine methyltransferase